MVYDMGGQLETSFGQLEVNVPYWLLTPSLVKTEKTIVLCLFAVSDLQKPAKKEEEAFN